MKLLKEFESVLDSEELAERLKEKGIAVFVSSKHSQSLSKYSTGALNVGLWIVLDVQYEDAKACLKNRRHKVITAISQDEIKIIQSEINNSSNGLILKSLSYALAFVVILLVIIYVISNHT